MDATVDLTAGRRSLEPGEGPGMLVNLRPYLDENCHYVVMGLAPDCTEAEVKDAYRKQAVLYHPDSTRLPTEEATPKFLKLQEAYAQLSDPAARRWYDYTLTIDTLARAEQLDPAAARAVSGGGRASPSDGNAQRGSRYVWPYEAGNAPEWSEEYASENRERAGYVNKGTDELANGELVPLNGLATIGLGADIVAICIAVLLALGIAVSGNLGNVAIDPDANSLYALLSSSSSDYSDSVE